MRDYVHVRDLAEAHAQALSYLLAGGASTVFNLGTGHGYSVRELIATARRVTGRSITTREGGRRPGDPAALVADARKAEAVLGWKALHSDLEHIVTSAWAWHSGRLATE